MATRGPRVVPPTPVYAEVDALVFTPHCVDGIRRRTPWTAGCLVQVGGTATQVRRDEVEGRRQLRRERQWCWKKVESTWGGIHLLFLRVLGRLYVHTVHSFVRC